MAVKVKLFEALSQEELEGQVNAFLVSLPLSALMDIEFAIEGYGNRYRARFYARIIYQE